MNQEIAADAYPEITHPKKRAFLLAYPVAGSIRGASRALGYHDGGSTAIHWLATDEVFAKAFASAKKAHIDYVEDMMMQRLENPQGNRGSDTLLMFKLNALAPELYRPATVILDTGAKDVLKKLDQLAGKGKDQPAIEGETDPVMAFARLRKGTNSPPRT